MPRFSAPVLSSYESPSIKFPGCAKTELSSNKVVTDDHEMYREDSLLWHKDETGKSKFVVFDD